MPEAIASLYRMLAQDDARKQLGFSPEMESAHDDIAKATTLTDIETVVRQWLHRFQPCLFGRIAAKLGLIHFCILDEHDLSQPDDRIRERIQSERSLWTKEAFEGKKSGFVILAISSKLTNAAPDEAMKQFAQRLCALYLLEEQIEPDKIYFDEIFLEKPGMQRVVWKWLTGINVFSANADRRWWQDHRIPGGLGFSVNSVGHLVKSGLMSRAMEQFDAIVGEPAELPNVTKVDSLSRALEFAMRTIFGASDAASGKATELIPLPSDPQLLPVPKCPAELPSFLRDKNYCVYRGYYHTDVTIPSDYFRPDVTRPESIAPFNLDFTYLFRTDVDNPAHITMGIGRRVRKEMTVDQKYLRGEPREMMMRNATRLRRALGPRKTDARP
jgi:hypothetical protein